MLGCGGAAEGGQPQAGGGRALPGRWATGAVGECERGRQRGPPGAGAGAGAGLAARCALTPGVGGGRARAGRWPGKGFGGPGGPGSGLSGSPGPRDACCTEAPLSRRGTRSRGRGRAEGPRFQNSRRKAGGRRQPGPPFRRGAAVRGRRATLLVPRGPCWRRLGRENERTRPLSPPPPAPRAAEPGLLPRATLRDSQTWRSPRSRARTASACAAAGP